MTHRLRFAARSDRGLLRSNNQDSVYAGDRLLIVADGMGGHAAGDLASRVVVAAFTPLDAEPPQADLLTILRRAMLEGNESIAEMVQQDPELDGMGTTATAMLFDGDRVALAHIGDSRAYLYRNGVLHQLSHDDTFVQSLVDDGRITEEEAAHHPQRNLLLRALNGTEPEPMLSIREISTGDRFLICSDGLSSVVAADAIADTLADPDPGSAADRLIELALVAGGPDNVTVIVADVIDVGARASSPTPAGPVDPEATGPIRPIHETQRMPRVPLPVADDRPTAAGYGDNQDRSRDLRDDDDDDYPGDDDYDDNDYDDNGYDENGVVDYLADEPDEDTDRTRGPVDPAARRRTLRRRWMVVAGIVVLLVGLSTGAVLWTRSHYFVGVASGNVVVFKGVQGTAFGVPLASVAEDSCAGREAGCQPIAVDDLQPSVRLQVLDGIPVADLQKAREVMATLHGELLPYCDSVPPGGTGSTGASTTGGATGTAVPTTRSAGGSVTSGSGSASRSTGTAPRTAGSPPRKTAKSTPRGTVRSTAPRTPPRTAVRSTPKRTAVSPPVKTRPGDRLHGRAGLSTGETTATAPATSTTPAGGLTAGRSGAVPDPAAEATVVNPFDIGPTNCRVRR